MNSFVETDALMPELIFQELQTQDLCFSTVNTDTEEMLLVSSLLSPSLFFAYLGYLISLQSLVSFLTVSCSFMCLKEIYYLFMHFQVFP